jgi:hypothetical protein
MSPSLEYLRYKDRMAYLTDGYDQDGYPHVRNAAGFCLNCGARGGEHHYRLVKRNQEETP